MLLRFSLIFSLFFIVGGCTKKQQEQEVQKQQENPVDDQTEQQKEADNDLAASLIVLDASHQMRNNQDMEVDSYRIPPCESLVVDHSYREFVLPEGQFDVRQRAVHLLRTDQSKYYRMVWEQGDNILLNNSTLTPRGNTVPFTRFKPGEEYFLAIGYDNFDDTLPEKELFQVIALYRIEVMEKETAN